MKQFILSVLFVLLFSDLSPAQVHQAPADIWTGQTTIYMVETDEINSDGKLTWKRYGYHWPVKFQFPSLKDDECQMLILDGEFGTTPEYNYSICFSSISIIETYNDHHRKESFEIFGLGHTPWFEIVNMQGRGHYEVIDGHKKIGTIRLTGTITGGLPNDVLTDMYYMFKGNFSVTLAPIK